MKFPHRSASVPIHVCHICKEEHDEWGHTGFNVAKTLRAPISVEFTHVLLGKHVIMPEQEADLDFALIDLVSKDEQLSHNWTRAWSQAHPDLWEEAKGRVLAALEESFLLSMRLAVHGRAALRVSKERLLEAVGEAHDQWVARSVQEE